LLVHMNLRASAVALPDKDDNAAEMP